MKFNSLIAGLLVVFCLAACGEKKTNEEASLAQETEVSAKPEFAAGQVWKYKNREEDPESTLLILQIENKQKPDTTETVEFIHIALRDLRIANPNAPGGFSTAVDHLPYDRNALALTVTELVETLEAKDIPPMGKGYEKWEAAFNQGQAAAFAISLTETIDFMEKLMNAEDPPASN